MTKKLKVLFLLEDLCYGGTQKQNLALAARLDPNRFCPEILTLTGPTDLDAAAGKIPLHHMGRTRKAAPLFFAALGNHLRKLRPDVLIPCTALPNIWGRLWGKALGIPVVIGTCRGGGAIFRQHEFFLRRLADGIICNSAELKDKLLALGCPNEKIRLIANGVDTEHFRPRPGLNKQNIVCVARLAQDKDHKTLLKAFAMLSKEFPQTRLTLIGEGPEEKPLRNFAASLGSEIASKIVFAGPSADPAAELAQGAVLALSSIREAQPNAILEGMASGLPICASAVGAIPETVGEAGLLNPPGNAEALADNIRLLLGNPGLARDMGEKGRKLAERNHSFAHMVKQHEDFVQWLYHKKQQA